MFCFLLFLLIKVSIKRVVASAHAQFFPLVVTVGNTLPPLITVTFRQLITVGNKFPIFITFGNIGNTFPPLKTVGNTFPPLITVRNTFVLLITVGNRFPLVITVGNTFPPLITVGKIMAHFFFKKNMAHLKCHLWATVGFRQSWHHRQSCTWMCLK